MALEIASLTHMSNVDIFPVGLILLLMFSSHATIEQLLQSTARRSRKSVKITKHFDGGEVKFIKNIKETETNKKVEHQHLLKKY